MTDCFIAAVLVLAAPALVAFSEWRAGRLQPGPFRIEKTQR